MTQEIRDFLTTSGDLLAFGEPTHAEPAFGWVRNELFAQLADHAPAAEPSKPNRHFRSIALETDRAAALTVNDFVQGGVGTLDAVMSTGFSHGFGALDANRSLVAWMRDYNQNRPPADRLAFHGFDAQMETMSAPSPRPYLEYASDYLGIDLDLASLAGADEQWSRTEAVMDPAESIGATSEAEKLRTIADDMLTTLYVRAPELIAATSRAAWFRAKTHLTAGLGLLRYHKQAAAQHLEQEPRWTRMCATRDALMAQNILDIRTIEADRGPTLVFSSNLHLQRNQSHMRMGPMELDWFSAGAIVASLGEPYTFVAGSLGRSETLELRDPEPDTYEGLLQRQISTWGLTTPTTVGSARTRTDATPEQGYFPLDQATIDAADAILHVNDGPASVTATRR